MEKTYRAAAAVQHNAHTLQTPYRDAAAVKHNAHLPVLLLLFNTTLGQPGVRGGFLYKLGVVSYTIRILMYPACILHVS